MDIKLIKKCSKCKNEKLATIEYFPKKKKNSLILSSWCRECHKKNVVLYTEKHRNEAAERSRKWYRENKERAMRRWRERYLKNHDSIKDNAKKYYRENLIKVKLSQAKYFKNNTLACEERTKKWRKEHPERCKILRQRWERENPDKVKKQRDKNKMRRSIVPKLRIDHSMSTAIYLALKKKKNGNGWESLVGYCLNDLIAHLRERLLPGMTLENYGEWHIDHIIPRSLWEYESPADSEFKQCWALANLQPLWEQDNIKKGARVYDANLIFI